MSINCPVCLQDIVSPEQKIITPCNHTFCKICYQAWTRLNNTCPVCRSIIKKQEFIPPYDSVYNRDFEIINNISRNNPAKAHLLGLEYLRWLVGIRSTAARRHRVRR